MSCPLHRAVLTVLTVGAMWVLDGASAATHIAAVTKNSVPAPSKEARKLPIDVASSKVDYKGDTVVFQDVVITQGDTKVQADRAHATGLDNFDNSRWTFEGNVRITGEQHGSLKSDVAIVEFKNKYIAKATATGNPAEFEQRRSDIDETAKGHAHQIVYNVTDGTVRLSEDAWVWDGHNEMSAHELVYDIREQHVQAVGDPAGGSQVHFKIDPTASDSNGSGEPQKKP
jgi:lipopolysaccharide transport protein LptA